MLFVLMEIRVVLKGTSLSLLLFPILYSNEQYGATPTRRFFLLVGNIFTFVLD
jgi:hypothetical protein